MVNKVEYIVIGTVEEWEAMAIELDLSEDMVDASEMMEDGTIKYWITIPVAAAKGVHQWMVVDIAGMWDKLTGEIK